MLVAAVPVAARVTAAPATSLADQPVNIRVAGLAPRARVTVRLRSVDAQGTTWRSSATFTADPRGRVDLDRAAPSARGWTAATTTARGAWASSR